MKWLFIFLIHLYRYTLGFLFPVNCMYTPSCSEYGIQALKKYGALKGSWLSVRRILRCNAFYKGGYDPVE